MTRRLALGAALATIAMALQAPAMAASVPRKLDTCVATTIKEIGTRLEGVADSGSAVVYGNGIYGVSYDEIASIKHAKVGDKVELCLVSIPGDCPAGDTRGKAYAAVDLRTQEYWELLDAEHMCGGA